MSVALRGNLEDFGIADVFQLIGQQRKTGLLEFTRDDGRVMQLRFDRGAVVSAAPVGDRVGDALTEMLVRCGVLTREQTHELERRAAASAQTVALLAVSRGLLAQDDLDKIEDLLTRETFFELLRWESGAFDFRAQPVEYARSFETLLGAEQILMDGLRMVDEWQSFATFVSTDELVFERTADFEEYRRRSQLDPREMDGAERVYELIDGRINVRRIIDLSQLGSFDAVRLLADLRQAEVITPLDGVGSEGMPYEPQVRHGVDTLHGAIAALVPLLILAALAAVSLRPVAPGPARDDFALEQAGGVESLRGAFATRRVRRALEAYRFAEGRWPDDLSDVSARGILPAEALASPAGRPYYYDAQREEGVVVLAPER